MAKFEIEGLDEVSLALRSVIDGVEDFNIELAQEAADITKEEIEKNIERHNHIRTGTLRRSIKTFKKKKCDGSPYIEVTATGSNPGPPGSKRKKYAGNAYIAFVLNYGRSNLAGSRFWTEAEQKAIEIFQPRLELKILNFLKEKGLK